MGPTKTQCTTTERPSTAKRGRYVALQNFTLARIPVAAVFAAFLLLGGGSTPPVTIPLLLLLALEFTDLVDGMAARRFGLVTEWGAMLDPYADSISRLVVYWALACRGLVLPLVPLAMAVRDVTVAYLRIILARSGGSVSARKSGKIKAAVQCCGGLLAVTGPWYWEEIGRWTISAISYAVIVVTLFSIIQYAHGAFVAARASAKDRFSEDQRA